MRQGDYQVVRFFIFRGLNLINFGMDLERDVILKG